MSKQELRELFLRIDDLGGSYDLKSKIINGALSDGKSRSTLDCEIDQAALSGDLNRNQSNDSNRGTGSNKISFWDIPDNDENFFRAFSGKFDPFIDKLSN